MHLLLIDSCISLLCRCIAVTTTLSEDKMQQAGPSLIRKNIGDVSIDDVLDGGRPNAYSM